MVVLRFYFYLPCIYFTEIDFFGPFYVKQAQSAVKRYGCVFTCLSMRAVHIEMSYFLSTDAFINTLRRFVNRRGKLHAFWSDNGTNLVGGYQELDQSKVNEQLRQKEIIWNFNPPLASHMG